MVLTPRQISVLFGELVDAVGTGEEAALQAGRAASDISKWRNPLCERLPPVDVIARLSKLAGNYHLLDVVNHAAGRFDETARLRSELLAIRALIDAALGDT